MKTTRITDIDACRMDIIRAAMQTDNIEVLNKMHQAYRRAVAAKSIEATITAQPFTPIPGVPSTLEEVKQDITQFEAELDAGTLGYTPEQFEDRMKQKHAWLCK